MKRFAIRTLLAAAAIGFAVQAAQAQVNVSVTLGGFYDELAPYGRWVGCSYGQCWVPARVAADWQPYSNGQWIYTEYGWTWVSDDPWGGNPYHYGTWTSIAGLGWAWVPGTVWAPAWVTWSYSNSYVGWAPIPPTVVFGASGYAGAPVIVSQTQYVFVTTNNFVGRNVSSVRIPQQQSAQIFRETRPVTGFAVSGGIVRNTALPMATIERASKRKDRNAKHRDRPNRSARRFDRHGPPRGRCSRERDEGSGRATSRREPVPRGVSRSERRSAAGRSRAGEREGPWRPTGASSAPGSGRARGESCAARETADRFAAARVLARGEISKALRPIASPPTRSRRRRMRARPWSPTARQPTRPR